MMSNWHDLQGETRTRVEARLHEAEMERLARVAVGDARPRNGLSDVTAKVSQGLVSLMGRLRTMGKVRPLGNQ
jgi:hypothetical protein